MSMPRPFGIHSCYKNIVSISLKPPSNAKAETSTQQQLKVRREAFGDLLFDRRTQQLYVQDQTGPFPPFLSAPEFVSVALTARCNLRCQHCYPTVYNQTLPFTAIARLFDDLEELGVFTVALSGGEPLLHKDFDKIAALGHQKGFHLQLFTNGILVNEERAQRIKDLGINEVNISLDAADAEQHNAFRGASGAFQKSVQAVRNLVAAGLETWITCTVNNAVRSQAVDLAELALELKVSKLRFVAVVNSGNAVVNSLSYDRAWQSQIDEVLALLSERLGRQVKPADYFDFRRYQGIFRTEAPYSPYGCGAGTSRVRITAKGQVLACPFLSDDLPGDTGPVSPDTILEKSFKEIWEQSVYLNTFRDGTHAVGGKCGSCEHNGKWCAGGCRAEAFFRTGRVDAADPLCGYKPSGYQAADESADGDHITPNNTNQRAQAFIPLTAISYRK